MFSLIKKLKPFWWVEFTSLAVITGLVYLMGINLFSYYRDDWYYAYDSHIAGSSIFNVMFSSDRPARGIFFEINHALFGILPVPYHIAQWVWRLAGTLSALWLFNLLWKRQRAVNFAMALLYGLYPGYLWWIEAIEYQPMIASAALHTISFALTLTAIQANKKLIKVSLISLAVVTGVVAIALVDYAIGMEAFRLLCIFIFVSNFESSLPLKQKIGITARYSVVPLGVMTVFLSWKLLIFEGSRKATDISVQIGALLRDPLETSLAWLGHLMTSMFNTILQAWWHPLSIYYSFLATSLSKELSLATFCIMATVATVLLISGNKIETNNNGNSFLWQAILLGGAGAIAGLFPVIMANRYVNFRAYSHYALPASLAVIVLIAGLLHFAGSKKLQLILISILVGIAVLTHRGAAAKAAQEKSTISSFWWQVYWRTPKIEEGTTITAIYPDIDYGEDIDVISGPANFLYYPTPNPGVDFVKYPLAATKIDKNSIEKIVNEAEKDSKPYRSHWMFINYRKVLVINQPAIQSCVHMIDARWPEQSIYDAENIIRTFPHSKIELAQTEASGTAEPLKFVFGPEPAHGWCYFYQKAELARQQGDWKAVADLGDKAASLQLTPHDLIEWAPFLQAHVILDRSAAVEELVAQFKEDSFHKEQLCKSLINLPERGYKISSEMQGRIDTLLCGKNN